MFLKLSKLFYLMLLVYVDMYIFLYSEINGLSLVLTVGMLLFYLLHLIAIKKIHITIPSALWCLLIFAFSSLFIGVLISSNQLSVLQSISVYFLYLCMIFYIINVSVLERTNHFFLQSFFIYSLIYLLVMHLFGMEWIGRLTLSLESNSNNDARTLLYGIFCLLLITDNKKIRRMIFSSILVIIYLYTIFLTGSRKAIVAGLFIWGLWFLFGFRHYWKSYNTLNKITTAVALLAISGFSLFKLFPIVQSSRVYERIMGGGTAQESNEIRSSMFNESIQFFVDNPLFGLGYNQYRFNSVFGTYSHSTYSELIATTGLIGTTIYLAAYVIIFVNLFKFLFETRNEIQSKSIIIEYLLIFITFISLGFGVIHFYGIIDNFILAILISFCLLRKGKVIDKNYIKV